MSKLRGTFLLRCWRLGRGEERYEIEHIQSGDRTVVASLPIASAWIEAHTGAASAEGTEDVGGAGAAPQTEARRGRGGHATGERANRGRAPPARDISS